MTILVRLCVSAALALLASTQELQAFSRLVPAAANAPGQAGAYWKTEVRVFNPSAENSVRVQMQFLSKAFPEVPAPVRSIDLRPRRVHVFSDVVSELGETGGGAILFTSESPLVITSRTYNSAQEGAFGVGVPAVDPSSGLKRSVLTHLSGTARERTNVGFVNTGTRTARLALTLRDGLSGEVLGSLENSVGGSGFLQLNDVFSMVPVVAAPTAAGVLEIESSEPVIGFATLIENATGDASFFLAAEDSAAASSSDSWKAFFTVPKNRGWKWRIDAGARASGMGGGPSRVIVLPDGQYRLFYNGPGGLLSSTSSNGLDFVRDDGVRLPFGTDPAVIYLKAGGYRFLYSEGPQGSRVLKSAVSQDGLRFAQESGIRYRPAAQDAGFVEVPHTVKLADGRWRLYYVADWFGSGGSKNVNNTRSAVSSDEGLTWASDVGSELTGAQTVDPDVVHVEGGEFRLYYKKGNRFFGIASTDGTAFPQFSENSKEVLDAQDRFDPTVIVLPDGTIRMFFGTVGAIGSATATD
jgi:hypothetical protein